MRQPIHTTKGSSLIVRKCSKWKHYVTLTVSADFYLKLREKRRTHAKIIPKTMSRTSIETKSRCLIINMKWSISREKKKKKNKSNNNTIKHQRIEIYYICVKKNYNSWAQSIEFVFLIDWMILTTSRSYIFPNIYIDYFVDVFNYIQYLCDVCAVILSIQK